MSDPILGERYFSARDRLSQVMRGITDLASENNIDLGEPLPLAKPDAIHSEPYRFVVIGEINAGKSTLINALTDSELCSTSDLPNTKKIKTYQYGIATSDDPVSDHQEDHHRPLRHLADFNWMDTPGISSDEPQWLSDLQDFLPAADLIFCVLPVANPWGAATWNFISQLPESTLQSLVLIVQQTDQRSPEDIPVILNHVNDLATKRLDHIPPVYAVSAKLDLTGDNSKSGMNELRQFISSYIDQLDRTQQRITDWQALAADALSKMEDKIEDQARNIRDQGRFMEDIEHEIHEIRENFIRRLPNHLSGVAASFEKEAKWVTKLLHRKLGALRSFCRLFIGDKTGTLMEQKFIERIKTTTDKIAEKDGREVVSACSDHWDELGLRVKDTMGIDLTVTTPIHETLSTAQKHFINRLDRAAHQGINNLKVRNQLDKELRSRNKGLKSFATMTLLLTTAGATCGALGVPWAPYILCALALVFLSGGVFAAWITRKNTTKEFQTRLLDTCGAFASTLHTDYEEALQIVFRDYADTLSGVREHMAREKLEVEPRQRRWQELFLTLKTIEQDL